MRRLAYTVHVPVWVDGPDGVKHLDRTDMFTRGEELPEWAVPLVGDHVFEDGEAPERNAPEPAAPEADSPAEPAPIQTVPKRRGRPPKKTAE